MGAQTVLPMADVCGLAQAAAHSSVEVLAETTSEHDAPSGAVVGWRGAKEPEDRISARAGREAREGEADEGLPGQSAGCVARLARLYQGDISSDIRGCQGQSRSSQKIALGLVANMTTTLVLLTELNPPRQTLSAWS